jgi:tetratricopeptide (TPR) repeat protein
MLSERPNETVLPETVQGLIAARLDTLPAEEKELLQDAAVIGKAFWLGALGGERWTLEDRLHSLERAEFVRRERRSTVAGESEYVFRHALVRDVAYEQIPRAQRTDKHRAAAAWIESLGRVEDHAEMLAHHYLLALELSQAAGRPTDELADAARPVLDEAGDRAFSLNAFAVAFRFYDRALALIPAGDAHRAGILFRRARAGYFAANENREALLQEASEALVEAGDSERAAETDALLAESWWHRGQRDRSRQHLDRALELVRDLSPSPAKAHVLSQVARYRALAEMNEDAIEVGKEALAMAEALGLDEIRAHALANVALAKFHLGDLSGVKDLEQSLEIALAVRSPDAERACLNLAVFRWQLGDFRRSRMLIDESIAIGERLGGLAMARYNRGLQTFQLIEAGEWDEGLRRADEFVAACEAGEPHYLEAGIRRARALARLARDEVERALDDVPEVIRAARTAGDPQVLVPALGSVALICLECGRIDEAKGYAREALAIPTTAFWSGALAGVAQRLDCADDVLRRLGEAPATQWTEAAHAELRGDFPRAADLYDEIGVRFTEAMTRLRAAEQLVFEGRLAEADEQFQRSLVFWRSVGASRYIRQGEALLAAAS